MARRLRLAPSPSSGHARHRWDRYDRNLWDLEQPGLRDEQGCTDTLRIHALDRGHALARCIIRTLIDRGRLIQTP